MWATSKKSRMVSQLEVESVGTEGPARVRDVHSVEGRVVVLCLSTWYFGVALTQISDITPQIWTMDYPTMAEQIWNGPCFGLVPLGAAVGVVLNHFLMNLFNRRIYLVFLNLLAIAFTALLQIGNTPVLYVFRILQGVVAGMYMNFVPTYIAELTPKELGSRFGVYPQISVVLGVLASFVVGMIMTDVFGWQSDSTLALNTPDSTIFWRVMLLLPLVGPFIQMFFLAFGYIPESPYSLIVRNRRENARDVLALFYQQEYVNRILQDREKAIFQQSSSNFEDKVEWTGSGYCQGFTLAAFQVLTGIVTYVTQAGHVMTVSFDQPVFGLYTPILLTISQLIGTLISVPMLKYIEWRYLTIIGGFALAFFSIITGVFFYLFDAQDSDGFAQIAITISMICIMAFMFTFGITVGSSVWPYVGYMIPGKAVVGAQVLNWFLSGASVICFSFNTSYYPDNNPFIMIFVFAGITLLLSLVNSASMINVKGLSVRKVQLQLAN